MSLSEAKAVELEKELASIKEELATQKAFYESQLQFLRAAHLNQIEALRKEVDNNYNEGLKHFYRCIMVVLERQYPNLKMDELAVGVTECINEQVAKEDVEKGDPAVTCEAIPPITASKATTPLGATGETPLSPSTNDDSLRADPPLNPPF